MCEQVCKSVVLTLHCGVGSVSLSGSVRPPTCLSVCLSVWLAGCLSVCLSVYVAWQVNVRDWGRYGGGTERGARKFAYSADVVEEGGDGGG